MLDGFGGIKTSDKKSVVLTMRQGTGCGKSVRGRLGRKFGAADGGEGFACTNTQARHRESYVQNDSCLKYAKFYSRAGK